MCKQNPLWLPCRLQLFTCISSAIGDLGPRSSSLHTKSLQITKHVKIFNSVQYTLLSVQNKYLLTFNWRFYCIAITVMRTRLMSAKYRISQEMEVYLWSSLNLQKLMVGVMHPSAMSMFWRKWERTSDGEMVGLKLTFFLFKFQCDLIFQSLHWTKDRSCLPGFSFLCLNYCSVSRVRQSWYILTIHDFVKKTHLKKVMFEQSYDPDSLHLILF